MVHFRFKITLNWNLFVIFDLVKFLNYTHFHILRNSLAGINFNQRSTFTEEINEDFIFVFGI